MAEIITLSDFDAEVAAGRAMFPTYTFSLRRAKRGLRCATLLATRPRRLRIPKGIASTQRRYFRGSMIGMPAAALDGSTPVSRGSSATSIRRA